MHCNVISDLHLDFADLTLPGGDVLIISGDAFEAKRFKKDMYNPEYVAQPHERAEHRADRYYRFMEEEASKKYRKVIYVMGNHEHYGFYFHKTYDHIKSQLPDNVHLLEKESLVLDGVLFLGATLWTDLNKVDNLTVYHVKDRMNDYRQITMFNEAKSVYHKLSPEKTVTEHRQTLQYFKIMLEENRRAEARGMPVVVCTHHAPSPMSTHPYFVHDTIMNGAYSSDLSEFILDNPEIKFWTHGHTHHPFRYKIGECEVICNPRGYAGHEQRADEFDPTVGFDITP